MFVTFVLSCIIILALLFLTLMFFSQVGCIVTLVSCGTPRQEIHQDSFLRTSSRGLLLCQFDRSN